MTDRQTIIDTATGLEALPTLAVELIDLLQAESPDVAQVAQIIAHDPASAANVLKLANSAALAPRQPIQSVKQAVMRIGLRKTTELVLSDVVAQHTAKPVSGYDLDAGALWQFSAAAAIACERLALTRDETSPPEAFTAGLLQDIGKIVLGHFVQVDNKAIWSFAYEQGRSFEEAERQVLGIDHAEVGGILLESWGIQGAVQDAVRWHHSPDLAPEASQYITQLVHISGQIVNLAGIGAGSDGNHYRPSNQALSTFHVCPSIVEQVMRETVSELDSLQRNTNQTSESSRL